MNYEAVYRTAPATPGLFKKKLHNLYRIDPLGQFGQLSAMSVCLFVCLSVCLCCCKTPTSRGQRLRLRLHLRLRHFHQLGPLGRSVIMLSCQVYLLLLVKFWPKTRSIEFTKKKLFLQKKSFFTQNFLHQKLSLQNLLLIKKFFLQNFVLPKKTS